MLGCKSDFSKDGVVRNEVGGVETFCCLKSRNHGHVLSMLEQLDLYRTGGGGGEFTNAMKIRGGWMQIERKAEAVALRGLGGLKKRGGWDKIRPSVPILKSHGGVTRGKEFGGGVQPPNRPCNSSNA